LDQRRVEIEVGYGLEGALPDVKCRWIIDDIAIPFFKAGSFSDGHYEMARALERGVRDAEIGRAKLIDGVALEPGASVDPAPADYELPHVEESLTDFNADAVSAAMAIIALPAGLIILLLWYFFYRRFRATNPEPYAEYLYYKSRSHAAMFGTSLISATPGLWEVQSVESGWSFLAVLPGLLLTGRQRAKHLQYLRDKPRTDPKTGENMKRLSESEDDAYLEAGNVSEEKLGSLDYDVWTAPSGSHQIEKYDGHVSADDCKHCGYKTYRQTSSRTISAATTSSSGLAEDTYECAHCGKRDVVRRTIPKISTSSSSGGGSSGGSSFGGGSSGGGGAGGSY
ncbi:MAG: TPM domain-containing protein, partial [Leptospirales bacterium]